MLIFSVTQKREPVENHALTSTYASKHVHTYIHIHTHTHTHVPTPTTLFLNGGGSLFHEAEAGLDRPSWVGASAALANSQLKPLVSPPFYTQSTTPVCVRVEMEFMGALGTPSAGSRGTDRRHIAVDLARGRADAGPASK